jgi:hypothetical protein
MMRNFAIVAVLAGCADLPAFDERCGNGVLDVGLVTETESIATEECDNNDPRCNTECQLDCQSDDDCSSLGSGYRCGVGRTCQAPSGVFEQTGNSFQFFVGQGTVNDIDGDGIGDVVGFSDITIDIRYGDPQAQLTTQSITLLPYSNTNIAIRTFAPGRSDILVPTPDGLVAYTASGKRLVAYPFAGSVLAAGSCATMSGTLDPIGSFEVDKHHIGFVSRHVTTQQAHVGILDLGTGECRYEPLCGISTAPIFAGGSLFIDHYETTTNPVTSIIAIGIGAPQEPMQPPPPQQVCITRFNGVPNNFTFQTLNGGTPLELAAGPMTFARASQGAVCPTLFASRQSGIDAYAPLGTASTCTLALTPTVVPGFTGGQFPAARIGLTPPIAGRGPDALVVVNQAGFGGTSEFFSLAGTNTVTMGTSSRALYPVLSADLDGNGSVEGVAAVVGGGGQGEPDIDVLYRTSQDRFITYRITTLAAPTHLSLGDFDGNGLTDIAYTERVAGAERLMLAYGTPDRPLPAIEIAKFHNISTFARIDLPDSIEPTGLALDDLLVVDDIDPLAPPELTVLHGNPQRSMLAYYDPRGPFSTTSSEFINVITGNFDPTTDAVDVLALELVKNVVPQPVRMWIAPGVTDDERLGTAMPGVATEIASQCTASSVLCSAGASYLRWPIDGRDIIIAADAPRSMGEPTSSDVQRHLVTIDPTRRNANGAVWMEPALDSSTLLDPRAVVFSQWGADIDGDGSANLVVVAGGLRGFGTPDEKVLDCTVGGQGHVEQCRNLASEIDGYMDWSCEAAETGVLGARSQRDPPRTTIAADVVVLCKQDGIGRVLRLEHDGALYRPTVVIENAQDYEFLSIGDVNGDHLDDIAGIEFDERFTPIVHLHLQCAASDVACIEVAGKVTQ